MPLDRDDLESAVGGDVLGREEFVVLTGMVVVETIGVGACRKGWIGARSPSQA